MIAKFLLTGLTILITPWILSKPRGMMILVSVLAIFFAPHTVAGEEGLLCYLPFDEGSGDEAVDATGNGNDLQLINEPRWAEGVFNGALEFDGTNWGEIPDENGNLDDGLEGLTLEAWVKQDEYHDNAIINKYLTRPFSYCLQTYSDGKAYFTVGNWVEPYAVTEAGVPPLGVWYHIAGTFDGNEMKIYINGDEVVSIDTPDKEVLDTEFPVEIASNHKASFFVGYIDEVAIYNRALTPAEIKDDMEKGVLAAVKPLGKLSATWGHIKLD